MNLNEIKQQYSITLAEKCAKCFSIIDSILVDSYHEIMKHGQIEISKYIISGNTPTEYYHDEFTEPYCDDMIKGIINHYSEDWDVTYKDKGEGVRQKVFIFSYKEDVDIQEPIIEVKEVIDKEFKTDRYSILDLK